MASAQVTKRGNAYLFRTKYTKGQVITYVMNMKSSARGQAINVTMPMTQKVVSVTKSGVATVSVSMGKLLMNGKPIGTGTPATAQKMTFEADSEGHVKGGGQQNTTISLPAKPIPVGGTWTATTNAPTGMGQAMQVTATYKLIGFERKDGFQTAKVSVTMSGSGQMAISGSGTMWLNMADGSMVRDTMKMSMSMGSMQMPMDISITRK
ncbi:MAG TPA: hypothetical protein VG820_11645 [Fimbriimonadaceae bacterium]|nr:hypothetical protein [Fimbriimonadaceae bacterium]